MYRVKFFFFLKIFSAVSCARIRDECLQWRPEKGEIEIIVDPLVRAANFSIIESASPSPLLSPSPSFTATVTPKMIKDPLLAMESCLSAPPTTLPSRLGFGKRQKITSSSTNSTEGGPRAVISESGIEIRDLISGVLLFGFCPISISTESIGHWKIEALGYGFGPAGQSAPSTETSVEPLLKMCALLVISQDDGVSLFFNTTHHLSCDVSREQGFVDGMSHFIFSKMIEDEGSLTEVLALLGSIVFALVAIVVLTCN